MSDSYSVKLCDERHKNTDETLQDHEHRIDILEKHDAVNATNIGNLIKKMDTFITVIMWGLGIFVTVSLFVIGILIRK